MKYLHLDLRALGLMRICLAIVILLDLSIRVSDLEAFYANSGAVPLAMVFANTWNTYSISLHAISGLWQIQLVLFLAAFFFAFMLMLGYRTRLFSLLSWIMMLSLHNRNSLILQGGDDLLRMVLFWSIFLPMGARYSCDAIVTPSKTERQDFFSAACVAYLLQICYIYTGSALLKGNEWHGDFTAMYYVYSLDQITYPITRHLLFHPGLLKWMTAAAYYFELLVPLLFFVPIKHGLFRTVGVVLILLFHSFNLSTLLIGMFPLIGMATCLGLLSSGAMNFLERKFLAIRVAARVSFEHVSAVIALYFGPPKQPRHQPIWMQRLSTAAIIFLTVFVFDWNLSNLDFVHSKLSDKLRVLGYGLRLDQNWGMFAPGVFKDDGWFVIEGDGQDGKTYDLLNPDSLVSYAKPQAVTSMFKNDRWRKYTENLILKRNTYMRGYFLNYFRRIWNERNPAKQIKGIRLIYMSEFTLPFYQKEPPKREVLWVCE